MMYEALHGDRVAPAMCKICSSDTEKSENLNSKTNNGLRIDTNAFSEGGKAQERKLPPFLC